MTKRKVGRPAGSGMQLPGHIRAKQSRQERLALGASRMDVTLDADTLDALQQLVNHWGCKSKKEAISKAIAIAASAIAK